MKNSFILLSLCMYLVSCGNEASNQKSEEQAAPVTTSGPSFINPIEYSSQFEMSNPKYSEKVVQLWDDFDNNRLDANKEYFADSVNMELPGLTFNLPLDSAINLMKSMRNSMPAVKSKVDAVMCVKSTDRMEDWVLIWGREYLTEKSGKIDSSLVHEIWRFNKVGKADYMSQFRREFGSK